MASREFHDQLTQLLPKMRVWALARQETPPPPMTWCRMSP